MIINWVQKNLLKTYMMSTVERHLSVLSATLQYTRRDKTTKWNMYKEITTGHEPQLLESFIEHNIDLHKSVDCGEKRAV